jgi:hypothetical protein
MSRVPHLRIVVATSAGVGLAYLGFSAWVILASGDVALIGDTIGTWKSFAVAAVSFWLGSSSAGKAKDDGPLNARIVNPPNEPVPTVEGEA